MSWGSGIGDAAALFFCFAASSFVFHEFLFCAVGASGLLSSGLGAVGEELLAAVCALGLEEVEESFQGEAAVEGLGAAVGGGHGESGGGVADRAGGADFVDVLAAGAAGAREGFLEVFG